MSRSNHEKPVFRNGKFRFFRVEADVYPRGVTFKHTAEWVKSKRRVVIRSVSTWKFGSLTVYVLMYFLIQIDKCI